MQATDRVNRIKFRIKSFEIYLTMLFTYAEMEDIVRSIRFFGTQSSFCSLKKSKHRELLLLLLV